MYPRWRGRHKDKEEALNYLCPANPFVEAGANGNTICYWCCVVHPSGAGASVDSGCLISETLLCFSAHVSPVIIPCTLWPDSDLVTLLLWQIVVLKKIRTGQELYPIIKKIRAMDSGPVHTGCRTPCRRHQANRTPLLQMGVFTPLATSKWFACKFAHKSVWTGLGRERVKVRTFFSRPS